MMQREKPNPKNLSRKKNGMEKCKWKQDRLKEIFRLNFVKVLRVYNRAQFCNNDYNSSAVIELFFLELLENLMLL